MFFVFYYFITLKYNHFYAVIGEKDVLYCKDTIHLRSNKYAKVILGTKYYDLRFHSFRTAQNL
jgi:hypothetical protein